MDEMPSGVAVLGSGFGARGLCLARQVFELGVAGLGAKSGLMVLLFACAWDGKGVGHRCTLPQLHIFISTQRFRLKEDPPEPLRGHVSLDTRSCKPEAPNKSPQPKTPKH